MDKTEQLDGQKVVLYCASADLISYSPKLSLEKQQGDWVTWGNKNNLPSWLFELYENCTILSSIINGITTRVMGAGFINNTTFKGKNEFGDTLKKVVKKAQVDINVTGGCFIQVKKQLDGQIVCAHIDPRKCRVSKDEKFIYVSDIWGNYGQNSKVSRPQCFNAFNPETLMGDGVQIYYYKGENSRGTYPVAEYKSAFAHAEIEIEGAKFDFNNIINGMTAQGVLNIAGDVPDEAREQIQQAIVAGRTGAKNAGKIFITFSGSDAGAHPVTYTVFAGNDADTRFSNTLDRADTNLFVAWQANPICFGMTVSTGFADQNFEEANELLYITHVVPKRDALQDIFGDIYSNPEAIGFVDIKFGQSVTSAENTAEANGETVE